MKKIVLPILCAMTLILSACTNFYQVYSVADEHKTATDDRSMQFRTSDYLITYDMWANRGTLSFDLRNLSDQTMYVYLNESFIVDEGHAADFRQLRIVDHSLAFAGEVVAIPAGDYRHFTCPAIRRDIVELCHVDLCPSPQTVQTTSFTPETSPVHFGVKLTYSIGADPAHKMVNNSFYVYEIVNYHKRNFEQCHDDTLRICDEMEILPVQDVRAPYKFYIEY
ncbi:MAG: hypothetical protein II757_00820 [Bacteroidales bacterium]|nr:hypothetical protein [Bacteroidales bacterium]